MPIIAHWSKVHIGLNFNSSSAGFDGKGSMVEVLALNMLNISQLDEESDYVMQPIPSDFVHGETVLSNVHIVQISFVGNVDGGSCRNILGLVLSQ